MLDAIRTVLARPGSALLEDALGVVALFALLVAGLNLPLFP